MKKILLAIFLLVSSLVFSAERILSYEETFLDEKTGKVHAKGEQTPYTGVIKNFKIPGEDGVFEGKISFKDGVIDGLVELYYSNGKLAEMATFKNGEKNGIQKTYYENGQMKMEVLRKNGKKDGIGKLYSTKGILVGEFPFKNDMLDGLVKKYNEVTGKLEIESTSEPLTTKVARFLSTI